MALFESLAGNSLVALAIIGILPTVYIGSIVAALLLKEQGAFILRISGMAVALIFAVILLMFGSGIGKVMAIVVLMLMFVPETAVGVIVGLIILVVLVVILAVVLIPLLGGELAAVGGRSAVGRAAPELMGTEREGKAAIDIMRQAGGAKGVPTEAAGAEKAGTQMVDEATQAQMKLNQEQVQAQITSYDSQLKSLQTQYQSATGNEKLQKRIQGEMNDIIGKMQNLQFPDVEKE